MSAKKRILNVVPFDDLVVLGISATLKDYKMGWFLNQELRIELKKMTSFRFHEATEEGHSFFYYDEGENLNVFNLIQINAEGGRLIQLPVPTDYLLIIRNPIADAKLTQIMGVMRKIQGVMAVYKLDIERLKQIDPLLEQIELHEFTLLREQSPKPRKQ
jgi:hypothetical protein